MSTATKKQERTVAKAQHLHLRPVSLGRSIRSEWIKLWTLPSTIWIIALTLVVMVGLAALMAWGMSLTADTGPGDPGAAPQEGVGPGTEGEAGSTLSSAGLMVVTFPYSVGQIVVAVLGVMVATSEYATGQIRATLAAVPTRTPVLVSKVTIVTVVSFLLGAIAVALSWAASTPILASDEMQLNVGDDGAWRTLIGVPLYLSAIALFSLGIGFLLRHTAGAISAVLGILLVLPIVAAIPIDWLQDLAHFLPGSAGERLVMGAPDDVLTEWQGFAVLCGYVVVVLLAAGVLLRRRDA